MAPIRDVLANADRSFERASDCEISSAMPHAAPAVTAVCRCTADATDDAPPRTTTALLLHWTMAELRYDRSSTSMRKLPTSWTADVPPPRDPCPPIATAGVPPPESRAPAAAACDDHRTLFRSHDESVITDEGADDDGVDATPVERGGPGTGLLATAGAFAQQPVGFAFQDNTFQTWTVPDTGWYLLDVSGGQGGDASNGSHTGGKGAQIQTSVRLTKGEVLRISVGGQGGKGSSDGNNPSGGGGGGSSSIVRVKDTTAPLVPSSNDELLLIVAGGGGAASQYAGNSGNATNTLATIASDGGTGSDMAAETCPGEC